MKYEYVKILNVDFLFEGLKKSLLFRGNPIGNLHQSFERNIGFTRASNFVDDDQLADFYSFLFSF